MGDKDVMLQGDEAVIRVTRRGVCSGFGINVWVRCKKKQGYLPCLLNDQGYLWVLRSTESSRSQWQRPLHHDQQG